MSVKDIQVGKVGLVVLGIFSMAKSMREVRPNGYVSVNTFEIEQGSWDRLRPP